MTRDQGTQHTSEAPALRPAKKKRIGGALRTKVRARHQPWDSTELANFLSTLGRQLPA